MPRLLLSDELCSKLKLILLQCGVYDKRSLRRMGEGGNTEVAIGVPYPGEICLITSVAGIRSIRNSTHGLPRVFGRECLNC